MTRIYFRPYLTFNGIMMILYDDDDDVSVEQEKFLFFKLGDFQEFKPKNHCSVSAVVLEKP